MKTFHGTEREYIDAFTACLERQGIPVKVEKDGTLHFPGLPADQNTSLDRARAQCFEQIGVIQTRNFTDEQLRQYYKARYAKWRCLKDHGYTVEPPQSWETYRDIARQTGAPQWDAFDGIPDADFPKAIADCPDTIVG